MCSRPSSPGGEGDNEVSMIYIKCPGVAQFNILWEETISWCAGKNGSHHQLSYWVQ